PLPSPPASSLAEGPDPESDLVHVASPTVTRLLATVVIDPSFESAAVSALVGELVDFAAAGRLDYAASLIAESESDCPPSVGGECALGTDVLEDKQDDFQCFAIAVPHFVSKLIAPDGDPDAPDIPTPRSYAESVTVPPPRANIVDDMSIFRRDYELHSLDFSTPFLQGSVHEEIWLRHSPGFIGSFPSSTKWSLQLSVYGLRQAPREWHNTLRTTLAALGFAPSTADPSLFSTHRHDAAAVLRPRVRLQKRHTCTDLGELSFSASASGTPRHNPLLCLLITRSELHLRTSPILARYVAPERHRTEHWEAAKRVLRYLCSTSGMGLVLGGQGLVVLTRHADASLVDDLATQRLSQGYTFNLGSGSVSWWSTRSSSVLSSSCEAEIYAGAMATQELRWLTYLLADLGEQPRSSPVLYVNNKAMIALCQEHILEHRTKHIALLLPCSRVAPAWSASSCLCGH
ncbi:unnamed protein product, partial [Closterium sp. NIES-53]